MPLSTLEQRLDAEFKDRLRDFDKRTQAALSAGKIQKDRIPMLKAELVRRFEEESGGRREKLGQMIQARQEAMGNNPALAAARPFTSALMNFGNAASFGTAPVIGGAIAGAIDPNRTMGEGIEDARMQLEALSSPTMGAKAGDLAGTIGGSFVGPRAVFGRGVDALVGAGAVPFVGRAAQSGALGRGIFEIGKAATSVGANVAGSELIEGVASGRDAEQIRDRVQTGLMVAAPFAAAGGTLATAFRTPEVDQAGVALIQRAKRLIPGFKATPDMLRQGSETQGVLRSLANVPGGRGMISRYLSESLFKPMRDSLDAMQRGIGPAQGAARAGRALSEIIPEEGARSFATARKGMMGQVFQAHGDEIVAPGLWTGVLRALGDTNRRARAALGSEGPRGEMMSGIVGSLRKMNKKSMTELRLAKAQGRDPRMGVTIQHLENLRQRLGEMAGYERMARSTRELPISARDARDARTMYHAITQVMRQQSPPVDQAFNAAKALRTAQKELEPLVGAARNFDPDQLVNQVFSGGSPVRQLRTLRQRMSGSENEALAGAYFGDFLRQLSRDSATPGGSKLLTQTMRNAFHGNGRFRASLFDEVVGGPQTRRDLLDLAEILDRTAPARAEGSATAGRALDALVAGGVTNLPKLALDVMHDPALAKGWTARGLGAVFSYTALKSVLQGGLGKDLNALATGQMARAPVRFGETAATAVNEFTKTK